MNRWLAAIRAEAAGLAALVLVAGAGALAAEPVRVLEPNAHMFAGETLVEAAGHQALYHDAPGKADKPLMVFVPGDAHLARIFYGFPGGRAEDFVAHWVTAAGHPFLAVSYPMGSKAFTETDAGYTIKDWGNQVAAIIAHVRRENGLTGPVIVAGWSMGGKIAASVGRAAKAEGFEIAMFVAMSADPPIPGFLPPANAKGITLAPDGYADRTPIYDWFVNAIAQQDAYNGHTIIPKATYLADFIGATPIDLIDTGRLEEGGTTVTDIAKAIAQASAFSFDDYPLPVVIHDNSRSDSDNVLLDTADWAFVRNRVLMRRALGGRTPADLSEPEWQRLRFLMATSGEFFTEVVEGTHFFFVGALGARQSVSKILALYDRVESVTGLLRSK